MPKRPIKNRALHPSEKKSPLKAHNPQIYEDMLFRWCATNKYLDYDDKEWGWGDLKVRQFFSSCLTFLQYYETLTWAKIKEEQHCHPAPLTDVAIRAKNRINRLFPDMDSLYQVKAQGKCRLFGHKDGQYLYLIWHDPDHTVYPGGR